MKAITDVIEKAIGNEKDARRASWLNARNSAEVIRREIPKIEVVAAVYDIETGKVEWEE